VFVHRKLIGNPGIAVQPGDFVPQKKILSYIACVHTATAWGIHEIATRKRGRTEVFRREIDGNRVKGNRSMHKIKSTGSLI